MKLQILIACTILLAINLPAYSQSVIVSESPNPTPEPSAILDVQSTTKGFLPPRLTSNQRNSLANPATGLVVYDTDMRKLYVYAGDFWTPVISGDHWVLTEENNLIFNNGDIGIGTGFDIPSALLHVNGTGTGGGNVLFSGDWKNTPGPAPVINGGTRLMWYPDKAAFRAGRVLGAQWNTENIGNYSSASGYNSTASGPYSNAWGSTTNASGSQSSAWGFNTIASGASATAFGESTTAPSFAETAIGYNNTIYTPSSSTTWVAEDRLFVIGNGSAGSSDALVMLKNGNTGLGISEPLYRFHAAGSIYASTSNWAIRGVKTGTTGTFPGVWGETESASANASGIRGFVNNTASGAGSAGVYGKNFSTINSNYGVFGEAVSTSGRGVYGYASSGTGTTYGVYGHSVSGSGSAIYGINTNNVGDGVIGDVSESYFGIAVWGIGPAGGGIGGMFTGDVDVSRNLYVSGMKNFMIDHPLDPANKTLLHFCIEGPEPYNLYRGTATLDESGSSWVTLPDYFHAINIDFSYQLTAVGAPMPDLHIGAPVSDGKFLVSGGAPGKQVCWEVTARRNDPWVRDNGFQTERPKPEDERGTYIYPKGYGQPAELQRDYKRIQQARGVTSKEISD